METNVINSDPAQSELKEREPVGVTTDEHQIRALLVEDNPGDARLIQIMLAEASGDLFEVETVDRLGAGLRRLAEGGIGIVLLDLSLPDSRGLATFTQLHAKAPRIPI
ncbi:MAG: response regulator, partial [Limisphaerales bacterium]